MTPETFTAEDPDRQEPPTTTEIEGVEAVYGEKMIELKVRFWTNDLAPEGRVRAKEGWTRGVVRVTPNSSHGINTADAVTVPFNSLMELPGKIEQVLIESGIVLHPTGKVSKYIRG